MPLPKTFRKIVCFLLSGALLILMTGPAQAAFSRGDASPTGTLKGDGFISIMNLNLKEAISVRYRNPDGSINPYAIQQISHSLRCNMTHKKHTMPIKLVELVDSIQDHFGGRPVQVISGYRSPEHNHAILAVNKRAAKNSLHMKGTAMDIRVPGVSKTALRNFAKSLKMGGVGTYKDSNFIHVDVGKVRYW